jgi:uncharacterized protein (DUF2147 family)
MKKFVVMLCVMVAVAGFCFAADPVEGYWLSVDEKTGKYTAGWEIYQKDGKLYGKILSLAEYEPDVLAEFCKESYPGFPVAGKVNQMSVVGSPWIFGLVPEKQSGQWTGGNIIDPNDGKMWKCKITFRAADGKKYKVDTLEMRGEFALGIGRSQFWVKADKEKASSLRPE